MAREHTNAQRGFSLKDQLFNKETVSYLAGLFTAQDDRFPRSDFIDSVMAGLLPLELKARQAWIADNLAQVLPAAFEEMAQVIEAALPPPLDPTKTDDDFGSFIIAPLGDLVVAHGMDQPEIALPLLGEITKRFSMEFAIRPFLNAHEDLTLSYMRTWSESDNYHQRRLVSEGTRPKLPWGQGIKLDPQTPLAFLTTLHGDPTRFVTRSVANHLNDLSKSDPDGVVAVLKSWAKLKQQNPAELNWMTRHALRTRVKAGHRGALEMLGYRHKPNISIEAFTVENPTLMIGDQIAFSTLLTAQADENLMVDFVIEFVKANGTTRPKVFKWKSLNMKKGTQVQLVKKHRFLAESTTFTHYPGRHSIALQVNGTQVAKQEFTLSHA